MGDKRVNIVFDAKVDLSNLKTSVQTMQDSFSKINLSKGLTTEINSTFKKINNEIQKLTEASNMEIKGPSDVNKITSSYKKVEALLKIINGYTDELNGKPIRSLISKDTIEKTSKATTELKKYYNAVNNTKTAIENKINSIKSYEKKLEDAKVQEESLKKSGAALAQQQVQASDKYNKLLNEQTNIKKQQQKLRDESGQKAYNKSEYTDLSASLEKVGAELKIAKQNLTSLNTQINNNNSSITSITARISAWENKISELKTEIDNLSTSETHLNNLRQKLTEIISLDFSGKGIEEIKSAILNLPEQDLEKVSSAIKSIGTASEQTKEPIRNMGTTINQVSRSAETLKNARQEVEQLGQQVKYFFGLQNTINLFQRAVRSAFTTVQDLDEAMTETAVVTDFNVSDMWDKLPQYTRMAEDLGTTIKGAYETLTLYYQQGLDVNEATQIGTETMKMARIANLDNAKATDLMTAALRGFNMELDETSAQRVNDVYSELAAVTASDTNELASAMTRTASIAHSANMEFETTTAFLAQMIETTRESAENLGTAMKTIIARFTEMKSNPSKIFDVEGEEVNINKVDAALKSVGISLKDFFTGAKGLDEIFLELASKWDSLDIATQRYVATMAAGSRQQSRFIAMMDNYDRTMELVDAANNSAGASAVQFEKTMESMDAKLARLKDEWDRFAMGLANSDAIKFVVDALTNLLSVINNIADSLGDFGGGLFRVGTIIVGLKLGKKGFEAGLDWVGNFMDGVLKDKDKTEKTAKTLGDKFNSLIGRNTKPSKAQVSVMDDLGKISGLEGQISQASDKVKQSTLEYQQSAKLFQAARDKLKNAVSEDDKFAIGNALGYLGSDKANKVEAVEQSVASLNNLYKERTNIFKNLGATQQGLNSIQKLGLDTNKQSLLYLNKDTAKISERISLNDELSDGSKRYFLNLIAENNQENVGIGIKARSYAALLLCNKTKRLAMMQSLGLASAEEVEAIAANGAASATSFLNAAIASMPLGWVLAGLAALAGTILWIASIIETDEEKLDRLNKTSQETSSLLSETTQKVSDLEDSKDSLIALQEEMDNLAEGTSKWKEKLLEVNNQVIELIDKYPELLKYVSNANGQLKIDSKAWDELINQQAEAARALTAQKMFNTGLEKVQSDKIDSKNYKEDSIASDQANLKLSLELKSQTQSILENLFTDSDLKNIEQIKTALGNSNALDGFYQRLDDITRETSVNIDQYAKLTGLTKEEVQAKKDNNELSDETIKSLIATNSLIQEINSHAKALDTFLQQRGADTLSGQWISGEAELTQASLQKMASASVFKNYVSGEKGQEEFDLDKIKKNKEDFDNAVASFAQEQNISKTQLEQMGLSFNILSDNLISSASSLKTAYKDVEEIGIDEKVKKLVQKIQEIKGTDLPISEIQTLSNIIAQVFKRGGNVDKFSSLIQDIYTAAEEKSGGLNYLTTALANIDFTSASDIDEFVSGIDDFGISTNVTADSLKKATNAAYDYADALEKQKKYTSLASTVKSKKGEDDQQIFDEDVYNEFKSALKDSGLLKAFQDNGDGTYTFIGKLDDLINELQKRGDEQARNNYETAKTNKKVADNWYGLPEALREKITKGKALDVSSLFDIDKYQDIYNSFIGVGTSKVYSADQQGIKDRLTSALSKDKITDLDSYIQALNNNINDVASVVKNALASQSMSQEQKNQVFSSIPPEILSRLVDENRLGADNSGKTVDQLFSSEGLSFYNKYAKQLAKTTEATDLLGQLLKSNIITQSKYDEFIKKGPADLNAALQEYIKQLSPQDQETANKIYNESLENLYTGKTVATDILKVPMQNSVGTEAYTAQLKAQEKAIEALLVTHEGYSAELENIKKKYFLTTDTAKKYLAVQYQLNGAVDEINSILSDYSESLTAKDKTSDYYEGIAKLTEQAKLLFGEKVDSSWVETNLDDLLKLSAGGATAEKALKALYDTSEATIPKITQTITTAEAKLSDFTEANAETVGTLETVFGDMQTKIETQSGNITSDIDKISNAMADLDGSNASITVKAQTKGALGSLIKTAMMQAVVQKDITSFNSLYRLALKEGLITSGIKKVIETNFNSQTHKLESKFTKDAAAAVSDVNFTYTEQGAVDVNYEGSGKTTNKYADNNSKKSSTKKSSTKKPSDKKSSSAKEEEPWKNTYDWLYNLTADINAKLREREKLEKKYDRLLDNRKSTAKDIYKNYKSQVKVLEEEIRLQQQMYVNRKQEIKDTVSWNSDLKKYAAYNWKDNTIEINWGNINRVTDNDLGDRIEEYISKLEELQDSMNDAEDAIDEYTDTLKELEEQGREDTMDFEQRVYDAILNREQKIIDNLSNLDETINNSNDALMSAIQENLDKIRQDRNNQKTEKEITDKERQLAYLQLDTSGSNELAIKQLQEELTNQEQDYTDNLIDQRLSEIEQQNEKASDQRQTQISIMQAQLDVAKNEGKYWNEVYTLINKGTTATGALLKGSELEKLLKKEDTFSGLSSMQKMDWLDTLEQSAKISISTYAKDRQLEKLGYYGGQGITFTDGNGKQQTGIIQSDGSVRVKGKGGYTTYNDVFLMPDGRTFRTLETGGNWTKTSTSKKTNSTSSKKQGSNSNNKKYRVGSKIKVDPNTRIYANSSGQGGGHQYFDYDPNYIVLSEQNGYVLVRHHKTSGYTGWFKSSAIRSVPQYKKGGIADFTGPAWLDGTKSSPELILNAKDTQNFLTLKEVLSSVMKNNNNSIPSQSTGDVNVEVNINVDKIEKDYDVEQLAKQVKKSIASDARYRNVNAISFMR